jgi:uncharacterized protein HemX
MEDRKNLEDRKDLRPQEFPDLPNLGLLAGVIMAAFIALGATVYFFGEDQATLQQMTNNGPAVRTEQTMKSQRAPAADPAPTTTGQGGAR